MSLVFISGLTILFGGGISLFLFRNKSMSNFISAASLFLGSVLGIYGIYPCFLGGEEFAFHYQSNIPFLNFNFALDPLSSFFLLFLFVIAPFISLYGISYLKGMSGFRLASCNFFINVLFSSMIFLLISANALLFLFFWELMALSSFILVLAEKSDEKSRKAAWIYFTATHIGTCFIIAFFMLLFKGLSKMDFYLYSIVNPKISSVLFIFALIGFGAKAGIIPFHVWLPEAHPAAPSHVSASMSGIMIKMGVYGLLRVLFLIGNPPPLWWGIVLVLLGGLSAFLGALLTVSQNELKRLLAYCSIENIGIIFMGIGIGFIGKTTDSIPLEILGFGGALLHVFNHAVFKSLLFLGAGSVLHSCGTLSINELGGIQKKMPVTGTTFLIGSVAICAIPPLNGFISEFLIYYSAFEGVLKLNGVIEKFFCVFAFIVLCASGTLAIAAFCKAYGMIFIGEPRTNLNNCHDPEWRMRTPMIFLSFLCVLIGFLSPYIMILLYFPLKVLAPGIDISLASGIANILKIISITFSCMVILFSLLVFARIKFLPRRKIISRSVTWDCGYIRPSARMEYTGSSFVNPITTFFSKILCVYEDYVSPKGLFPKSRSYQSSVNELFRKYFYDPIFSLFQSVCIKLRVIQHGNLQLYVLYIAVTLVILLLWKVLFA